MFCVVKGAFVLALPAAVAERSATNFLPKFRKETPSGVYVRGMGKTAAG